MTQSPTTASTASDLTDGGPSTGDVASVADVSPPSESDLVDVPAQQGAAEREGHVDDGVDEADDTDAAADGAPRRTAAQRLEEEGDVAADYLEELLDITDLDGDIDIDVENGRAAVSIVADQEDAGSARALKRLVGADGQVLEALQELTRLAVQAKTGERTRLMLDVAGFRAGRRTELEGVALAAVAEVGVSGAPVSLDPMSPFERKVVHDAVAGAGLRSESEGENEQRHVVVLPAEA